MQAIITGDIIQSRNTDAKSWLSMLKKALNTYGATPQDWEIYRGDSFQLATTPQLALEASIIIKASIKKLKNIDVRMGIGIGKIVYRSEKITESNGSAFVYSGDCFDSLKKQTLAIKTPWEEFDFSLNIMLELAALTMDRWKETTAEIMLQKLIHPELSQQEIAKNLNKKGQGNISEGLKRGGYDEINKLLMFYHKKIKELC